MRRRFLPGATIQNEEPQNKMKTWPKTKNPAEPGPAKSASLELIPEITWGAYVGLPSGPTSARQTPSHVSRGGLAACRHLSPPNASCRTSDVVETVEFPTQPAPVPPPCVRSFSPFSSSLPELPPTLSTTAWNKWCLVLSRRRYVGRDRQGGRGC